MLKLAFPLAIIVILAFIRGVAPTVIVALALLVTIGLNRLGNSQTLSTRATHELFHKKFGVARLLLFTLPIASLLITIFVSIFLFRSYDWVVGVCFIIAFIGYFAVLSMQEQT